MVLVAGGFTTYLGVGLREDLSDIIYSIAPSECPMMNMFGRGSASGVKHEWQTDSLRTPAANAQLEGDVAAASATTATVRLHNFCQISYTVLGITGTEEAVDKAGRKSELAYQLTKRGKELKTDVEFELGDNAVGTTAGGATTARTAAGLPVWYETNGVYGAGGANSVKSGTYQPTSATATDGTVRGLTESLMKSVIQSCWTQGGNPTTLLCGPFNKTVISGFTGGSTRFDIGEDKKLVAAIDVYVSDFGTHRCVASRISRERDLHVLDPKMWSVDYLRGFRQFPLAKTADAERRQLLVEWTLRSSNEKASGHVADLSTS